MTETAGATCPTCATGLRAAGAECPRCSSSAPGSPAGGSHLGGQYQGGSHPGGHYQAGPPPVGQHPYGPYAHGPHGPYPYPPPAHPSFPPVPVQYTPVGAVKSAGVAVLLSFLWIGAGHLYLDRVGTGLTLMGAHFVLGFMLFFIFAPLGFVVWLAAFITCAVVCSNLANQINAGTAPQRATW